MKKEAIYLSLAMLAMATTPYKAHAQEMEDSTLQLKEVTISTTRMPEVKQNAAATVTIIDQKQIAEMSKATFWAYSHPVWHYQAIPQARAHNHFADEVPSS